MAFLQLVLAATALASYSERLALTPLPQNMLLSEFSFVMDQDTGSDSVDPQYTSFPRSLGQILDRSATSELHLRFGQGWWDHENWGQEPENGVTCGGIGVEMWAWVRGDNLEEALQNWHVLTNSLSGYFCASLNFIDIQHTSYPSEKVYGHGGDVSRGTWLLRGALPGEPICTENLTPFLKLLPCKGRAGIASLLDGHTLFDSQWQTMAADVHKHNDTLQLRQTISSVVDVLRMLQRRDNPLPIPAPYESLVCDEELRAWNPYACYPRQPTTASWRLSHLYGHTVAGACPIAGEDSGIVVNAPENWETVLFRATDGERLQQALEEGTRVRGSQTLALDGRGPFDVLLQTDTASSVSRRDDPPVLVDRSFTGRGQQRGGLRTVFTNDKDTAVNLTYFESLPWYMRVYLHTLTAIPDNVQPKITFHGSQDRGRPSQLELNLQVEPHSQVTVEYKFDKSLLFMEEYPPDANHGFAIAPGVVVTSDGYITRTTSLLVSLPVPDFSMPYNVIILTSTIMSLAFGNIFRLITGITVPEAVAEQMPSDHPLKKIVNLLRRLALGR